MLRTHRHTHTQSWLLTQAHSPCIPIPMPVHTSCADVTPVQTRSLKDYVQKVLVPIDECYEVRQLELREAVLLIDRILFCAL